MLLTKKCYGSRQGTQEMVRRFRCCRMAGAGQYNWQRVSKRTMTMSIGERIGADIVTAMKARQEHRVTTLRMVKSALKSKEIDKRQPLTDAEETAILSTLLKQRRESVESFTKGNRPELAAKEQAEIGMIEAYMPQSASEEQVREIVQTAIAHMAAEGQKPGPRDMGAAMKLVQQRILASGMRADGKMVSEMVKAELAK
jgi:uncharacterized protein